MSKTDDLLQNNSGYFSESLKERSPMGSMGVAGLETPAEMQGRKKLSGAFTIELSRIFPDPDQPRKTFDQEALDQLAHSLKQKGQLQPARVRWDAAGERYLIIAGERRYRAAKLAGLTTLECIVHNKSLSEDELLEIQLIENCVREDLDAIEQAKAYQNLMKKKNWTQGALAENLRISRPTINAALSLLKLPGDIQSQIAQGKIPPSAGREIARLASETEQREVVARYLEQGITAQETAATVRVKKGKKPSTSTASKKLSRTFADGQRLTLSIKRRESLGQIADRLADWTQALRADSKRRDVA